MKAGALIAAALGIVFGAWAELEVPGSPVPVSLQTLMVVVAGIALGPSRGALATALYLALGAIGLPVYADGKSGVSTLFGATGGYLFGFVLGAAVAGWLTWRSGKRELRWVLPAALLGQVVVVAIGVPWLAVATGRTMEQALAVGCWPFLPGLVIKALMAAVGFWAWERWRA